MVSYPSGCIKEKPAPVGAAHEAVTMRKTILLAVLATVCGCSGTLGDWPTYRCDAARSGYTSWPLSPKLALRWVYRSADAPRPAWPRSKRLRDDRAYHVAVAAGTVYFGGSADCHVHAMRESVRSATGLRPSF